MIDNQHIKMAMEIHTTKFHVPHQFLPSRDVAKHIHSLVYGHLPAYTFKKPKKKGSIHSICFLLLNPLSPIFSSLEGSKLIGMPLRVHCALCAAACWVFYMKWTRSKTNFPHWCWNLTVEPITASVARVALRTSVCKFSSRRLKSQKS